MKKYGKYEKRPVVAVKKEQKLNSMLLQTYLTSLLCLVLCVTMFFGTSYAWFTSEVTSYDNEIYIGTLDVDLYKKEGRVNLAGGNEKVFNSQVRWEPGYTMLETITVENNGDLAFNYELNLTDGKVALPAENAQTVEAVAACFDVWVYDHQDNKKAPGAISTYADICAENGWVEAGSLAELLAGKPVLTGVMDKVRNEALQGESTDPSAATEAPNPGTTDGIATMHTYTIALHMREDATSVVMGHKITLNVKLIAYQMTSEKDSIQATEGYDNVTAVTNLKEFKGLSGNVVLASDIKVTAEDFEEGKEPKVVVPAGIYLDGDNKTITFDAVVNNGQLSFEGGKITNLTVNGGEVRVKASDDVVLSNCDLDKLVLEALKDGSKITLVNCTVGGKTVEKAVLTVIAGENNTYVVSSDNDQVAVTNNSVVIADKSN